MTGKIRVCFSFRKTKASLDRKVALWLAGLAKLVSLEDQAYLSKPSHASHFETDCDGAGFIPNCKQRKCITLS